MKFTGLSLFFFFFISIGFAQDINSFWNNANSNYKQKEYTNATLYCDSILEFKNQLDSKTIAQVYLLQAQSLFELGKVSKAEKAINNAQVLKIENPKIQNYIALTRGDIALKSKDYKTAINAFEKALTFAKSSKEKLKLAKDLSYVSAKRKKYKEAIKYGEEALALSRKIGDQKEEVKSGLILTKLYSNYGNYDASQAILDEIKEVSTVINDYKKRDIEKVEKSLEENKLTKETVTTDFDEDKKEETALFIQDIKFENVKSLQEIEELSEKMQLVEYRIKAQADEYEKRLLKEQLNTLEKEKQLELSKLTVEKTKAELLAKDAKLSQEKVLSEKRKVVLYATLGVLFLASLAILMLFFLFRNKKRSNKALMIKNKLISEQKSAIKSKSDQIHDSIQYAQKIQQAILPSVGAFKSIFPKSFIYLNPKEKVSGDFFWFHQARNYRYAAAIDCTGHGVPGAFMTIICRQILNDIVSQNPEYKPSEILTLASKQLEVSFLQYNNDLSIEVKDGMDLSLIRIDEENNLLHSGARNPLYLIRNNELIELKGTRKSVSALNTMLIDIPFKDNMIQLLQNDYIYFFSDGFVDQKGERTAKKYYYKNFRDTLRNIAMCPIDHQLEAIKTEFETWKGNQEQLDDVLIIGIDPFAKV